MLVPDFMGKRECLDCVIDAQPDVFNHNLETVLRLQLDIRKAANYERSLGVLRYAKERGRVTKSGLMLGLGETDEEILQAISDLRASGVSILTLGQYLQPSPRNIAVDRWVTPASFVSFKQQALAMGFSKVESGPLVRSSYHADEQIKGCG